MNKYTLMTEDWRCGSCGGSFHKYDILEAQSDDEARQQVQKLIDDRKVIPKPYCHLYRDIEFKPREP